MPTFSPSRILQSIAKASPATLERIRSSTRSKPNWSNTLALPKAKFPPRPTAQQSEEYQQRCADDLYHWQKAHRPRTVLNEGREEVNNEFVLHDGPPYANGAVHIGHALNKVLKDLILRSELARGKRVHYRPGWDCHGLPIELKALQQPKAPAAKAKALKDTPTQEAEAAGKAARNMSALEIRQAARRLASDTIEVQKQSFRAWGVMGEWDRPYKTMDADFETRQLGVFREMVRKGLISRHHRPVYWSPSSRTALAEAELEYDDQHRCTAAFVKLPFVRLPRVLESNPQIRAGSLSALIWTTTPWTLPANKAVAVKSDIEYCVVEIQAPERHAELQDQLLIARERVEHVLSHLPAGSTASIVVDSVTGSDLADGRATCFNVFTALESPVLNADFVTTTSGTGLVHMAPGHGMDDYLVCERNGVGPVFAPVDDGGKYTSEAFPAGAGITPFAGLDVQTEGVKAVLEVLGKPGEFLPRGIHDARSSLLLAAHKFVHKNPIDWRTKQPVIVRATAQWFADVSAIKDRALAALEDVRFIPESGRTRLKSFVEGRSQWCISRQRAWGVPIPALYHRETGEAHISDESIGHIISVIEQRGSDVWFADSDDHAIWICPSFVEPGKWIRGKDTMDVWFDSGTTWTSLDERDHGLPRSDVYSEGTDQHRGWFQSSLLTAIATQDPDSKPLAPFRILATHGFTLDGKGRKMSKSLGNVIDPEAILSGSLLPASKPKNKSQDPQAKKPLTLGPDILRLWAAAADYTRDVAISQPVLASAQQALTKYRVTFKFLLGVLADYPSPRPSRPVEEGLDFADRTVLHDLARTSRTVCDAYASYDFAAGVGEINRFVNGGLSAFYLEVVKDRLYAGDQVTRRRTQSVLMAVFDELVAMLGPVTPFLVEEVWAYAPERWKANEQHPLRRVWTPFDAGLMEGEALGRAGEVFRLISSAVKIAQEQARTARMLGSGLACRVEVHFPDPSCANGMEWLQDGQLADLLVVSQADVVFSSSAQEVESTRLSADVADWRHEQPLDLGEGRIGKVAVLPPAKAKCVRCWKYTAEEPDLPCGRCRAVLAEKLDA